jgi:pimeloyl-ACP methyl ester carboxylesterase
MELFLTPLHAEPARRDAAARVMRSFDLGLVHQLAEVHARIGVPVQLVWGEHDAFLPVTAARSMVDTFPDARLAVIEGCGLFSHEERPDQVAAALRPLLGDA